MQIRTIKWNLPKRNLENIVKSEHFKHLKYRPNPEFRMAWDKQFYVWKAIVAYIIMMRQSENGYIQKRWSSPHTWCTSGTSGTTSSTAFCKVIKHMELRLNSYLTLRPCVLSQTAGIHNKDHWLSKVRKRFPVLPQNWRWSWHSGIISNTWIC